MAKHNFGNEKILKVNGLLIISTTDPKTGNTCYTVTTDEAFTQWNRFHDLDKAIKFAKSF